MTVPGDAGVVPVPGASVADRETRDTAVGATGPSLACAPSRRGAVTGLVPAAERLLDLATGGRPRPAIELVLGLLTTGASPQHLIAEVLAPVQRQVGVLWETSRWSVADEHAATAVVDGVLSALSLQTAVPEPARGEVLVACAEGEHHTMPPRMGAELLRAQGWEVTFLGGSMPADDLQRFVATNEPDVVLISCTVPLFLSGARRCLAAVGALGVPTVAVGAAFGDDATRALRLGAGGWLPPGGDLAVTLVEARSREARVWPVPPEALALELEAEDLLDSCITALLERVPQVATYTAAQLGSTRTDVAYILAYLTMSVDLDDDELFGDFTGWLTTVLATRGVPPSVLDRSLEIISEVVVRAGMHHAARLCDPNRRTATDR